MPFKFTKGLVKESGTFYAYAYSGQTELPFGSSKESAEKAMEILARKLARKLHTVYKTVGKRV